MLCDKMSNHNMREGFTLANYVTNTSDKSKGKALLLCILLGWIPFIGNCYYWYVGRRGGILRTLTANYFLIGWIKDIIKIATGGFVDNVGAPLRA